MKIISQTQSNTCVAATLAMISSKDELYIINWFKENLKAKPPFNDGQAIIFLAHHGIYFALAADLKENNVGIDISNYEYIQANIELSKQHCYMITESENLPDLTHAVYWNTKNILDPLYQKPRKLSQYKVRKIYPIMLQE